MVLAMGLSMKSAVLVGSLRVCEFWFVDGLSSEGVS
jgi:hypothetical protein